MLADRVELLLDQIGDGRFARPGKTLEPQHLGLPADNNYRALNTAIRVLDLWSVAPFDQSHLLEVDVGDVPSAAIKRSPLSAITLLRASDIVGIYGDLQVLLPSPRSADAWVSKPNAAPGFDGRSALDLMLQGETGIQLVRRYLAAQSQGRVGLTDIAS
ncbi:DUF2384 domain-containing protein [Sphingomonas koreensis]|nr:DUF2384 domain-containing protein [Sphingomonas koreensis]